MAIRKTVAVGRGRQSRPKPTTLCVFSSPICQKSLTDRPSHSMSGGDAVFGEDSASSGFVIDPTRTRRR